MNQNLVTNEIQQECSRLQHQVSFQQEGAGCHRETISKLRLRENSQPQSFTRGFLILAPQWDDDLGRKKPVFDSGLWHNAHSHES